MEYSYNILGEVYEWMISKKKNVEVRILKEKSEKIQVGDYITFNNQDVDGKYVRVQVVSKKIFNSIEELLETYDVNRIMPDHTEEELKDLINRIYGDALVNGKLVALGFDYLSSDVDCDADEVH